MNGIKFVMRIETKIECNENNDTINGSDFEIVLLIIIKNM